MTFVDMPAHELESYTGSTVEPRGFDEFWRDTLAENPFNPETVRSEKIDTPLRLVDVWDVTYGGFAGDPIHAWLIAPAGAGEPLPTIVQFNGYGGGRGFPDDHLRWASAGFAHLIMDTRGQGSAWGSGGQTPDPHGSGPAFPGVMTKGIEDKDSYYYRRLYVDAHHAVETAATFDIVDSSRIIVTGHSQGAGLTIAAAALNHRVIGAMPDEPFLCDFPRAIGLAQRGPYPDVVGFLKIHRPMKEQVLDTLSYFDGVHLAKRAQCPTLFSVALMDDICPPSTAYAAFHAWGSEGKEMTVWDYNGHEGGETYQWRKQIQWVKDRV